eukprot:jgi/Mesen1/7741/ME000407S06966
MAPPEGGDSGVSTTSLDQKTLSNGSLNTMEQIEAALKCLRAGQCVAVLDDEDREGETDLFFPAAGLRPADLRQLRTQAGGELYISVGHEVATTFGIPYAGEALRSEQLVAAYPALQHLSKGIDSMCQGSCSVGLSLDHRSTKTGAPDVERSLTCRRLAELWDEARHKNVRDAGELLGKEFHIPGHIFLCMEQKGGLNVRSGHTELSVHLAKQAGIAPLMVGCVMLSNDGDDFGALPPHAARKWASKNGVPFLTGKDIMSSFTKQPSDNGSNAA